MPGESSRHQSPPDETDGAAKARGEELGVLAAAAAVVPGSDDDSGNGAVDYDNSPDSNPIWPNLPGVFFPEPYLLNFSWSRGLPDVVLSLRETPEPEQPATDEDIGRAAMAFAGGLPTPAAMEATPPAVPASDVGGIPSVPGQRADERGASPAAETKEPVAVLGDADGSKDLDAFEQEKTLIDLDAEEIETLDDAGSAAAAEGVEAAEDSEAAGLEEENAATEGVVEATDESVVELRADEIELAEDEIELAGDEIELAEDEIELAEDEIELAEDEILDDDELLDDDVELLTDDDVDLESLELDDDDLEELDPSLTSPEGPDSGMDLDDADIEEITADSAQPAPREPRLSRGSTPPLPITALDATQPMRSVKPPPTPPKSGAPTEEAAVVPVARRRRKRRVRGPRPTTVQPSLTDGSFLFGVSEHDNRPSGQWWEVIFDDSYFACLPAKLHRQTRRESKFIHETLRLRPEGRLLDLACGFGRHALELAKLGHQITGLDLSKEFIRRAREESRRRGVDIDWEVGDMRELTYDSEFDATILMGQSYGYFDDRTSFRVLENIRNALKPKGRLLLDLLNRDRLTRELPKVIWWRGQDCLLLEEVEFNFDTSRMVSKRTVVFDDGRPPWEQFIEIRLYSLHEIYNLLESSGFRVLEVTGSIHHPGIFFVTESRQVMVLAERA